MTSRILKAIEFLLAMLLLGMVVMVFGNVVLRYAFNSGIEISEELSRFFFVWLTFIGAIVAMHDGSHLGMDAFVSKLPRGGKVACLALCQGLILLCCAMLFWGTWRQHEVNATTAAPVTGLSMIWVYGIGYLTSVLVALHAAHKLWRLATGRITDDELIDIAESEEPAHPAHQEARA